MNYLKTVLLFYVTLVVAPSFATGPRVTPSLFTHDVEYVYAQELAPYISTSADKQGGLADVVHTLFKTEKIEAEIMVLPSINMLTYYFSEEKALAVLGRYANFSEKIKKTAIFIPILTVKEFYIYAQPAFPEGLNWQGDIAVFKGKTYGAMPGEDITAYKDADIHVKYGHLSYLLKKLQAHEIDFIRLTAAQATDLMAGDNHHLVRLVPEAATVDLGIAFNKQHPQGVLSAKKFSQGLAAMKKSGVLTQRLKPYLSEE